MADAGAPSSSSTVSRSHNSVRIETLDLWSFYNHIRPDLPAKVGAKLRKVFEDYDSRRILLIDFEMGVLDLIKGYPNVVWSFKTMLRVILGEVEYLDKVRVQLIPDTGDISNGITEYIYFLKNLREYSVGRCFFPEFRRKVREVFRNHPKLWEVFNEYLYYKWNDTSTSEDASTTFSEADASSTEVTSKKQEATGEGSIKSSKADASSSKPDSTQQTATGEEGTKSNEAVIIEPASVKKKNK